MQVDHLGIAVRSLDDALAKFAPVVREKGSPPENVDAQGVRVSFLEVGESHLEFLEPLRPDTPVGRFLEKRGEGMHHLALRVPDVGEALRQVRSAGGRLIDEVPRIGARGRTVGFAHPTSFQGVLVEFVGVPP
ncbi:MAG: methylmalonyl-CoA epimerase [Thermoplasmata archaeon]|nr:methylmalonyl-CoA epimerase [Thermoplasmata archaeon]MCI4357253.1 methylmalonyl-CoA epimerase [Thermoplasmata archaeon]